MRYALAFLAALALCGPVAAQVTGSIQITVEEPPPEPPAALIWDGPTTGAVGDTLRISYVIVDANGDPTEGVTAWAVSDGNKAQLLTVTDSTLAVELLSPGTVRLDYSVSAPGGGPDPLPPPDGGGFTQDPPPGFVLATRNEFPTRLYTGGWDGRTECCGANPASTLTWKAGPTPENTGDTFARFTYTTDYQDGAGTAHLNYFGLDAPSIYVRAWVRLVDWEWHQSGVNKFGYVQTWDAPCGPNRPWILNFEGNAEPGRVGFVGQCDDPLISRYAGGVVRSGEWVEVAWLVEGATDDTGMLAAWVGTEQALSVERQTLPAGYPLRILGFHGAPIWGGVNQALRSPQFLDIAAIEIWVPGG